MRRSPRELFFAMFLMVLCAAGAFFFSGDKGKTAVVTVEGETVYTFLLDEIKATMVCPLETEPKTWVQVSEKGICFLNSQCPDKICLGYGILNREGENAVCLPAKAMIRVTGDDGYNAVAGG